MYHWQETRRRHRRDPVAEDSDYVSHSAPVGRSGSGSGSGRASARRSTAAARQTRHLQTLPQPQPQPQSQSSGLKMVCGALLVAAAGWAIYWIVRRVAEERRMRRMRREGGGEAAAIVAPHKKATPSPESTIDGRQGQGKGKEKGARAPPAETGGAGAGAAEESSPSPPERDTAGGPAPACVLHQPHTLEEVVRQMIGTRSIAQPLTCCDFKRYQQQLDAFVNSLPEDQRPSPQAIKACIKAEITSRLSIRTMHIGFRIAKQYEAFEKKGCPHEHTGAGSS